MTEGSSEKRRPTPARYVTVFLAGALVGALVIYLVQGYRHEAGRFAQNRERDAGVESAAQRAWAERVELPGVIVSHP